MNKSFATPFSFFCCNWVLVYKMKEVTLSRKFKNAQTDVIKKKSKLASCQVTVIKIILLSEKKADAKGGFLSLRVGNINNCQSLLCVCMCARESAYLNVGPCCLFIKWLLIENFSQHFVDGRFINLSFFFFSFLSLVFKLDLCCKIMYINCSCPFHITDYSNGCSHRKEQ